ncbi:MAG: hypothetical protein V1694_01860 [Candidatus Eisenbacteria bacterium]
MGGFGRGQAVTAGDRQGGPGKDAVAAAVVAAVRPRRAPACGGEPADGPKQVGFRSKGHRWRALITAAMLAWLSLAAPFGRPAHAAEGDPTAEPTAILGADIILTDLSGNLFSLGSIAAGQPTLLFICDPAVTKCREGAVHFDSQSGRIEAREIRPACVLVADYEAAREAAARLDLGIPVYVDAARAIPARLIRQAVLPALILLDGRGRVTKIAVGGGESLDGNITAMLERGGGGRRRALAVLIPLAIFASIFLALE